MAKLSIDELVKRVQTYVGERTDDETLAFVQDFTETMNDLKEHSSTDEVDKYKKQLADNDNEWRKKFRDTFFNKPIKETETEDSGENEEGEKPKILKYEDLFKEEK